MSEQWIVARTKSRMEFIAKMNLEAQDYVAYLPLVSIDGVMGPLLPGYIFVATWPRQGLWRPVTNTRGVSGVLMTGEAPSVVPERDIDALKFREEGGVIKIKTKPVKVPFKHGDKVRITAGAFEGLDAIFDCADTDQRLTIFVEFMKRQTKITVDRRNVA